MERFDINKELKNLEGLSVRAKCSALDDLCCTLREAISDISNAKNEILEEYKRSCRKKFIDEINSEIKANFDGRIPYVDNYGYKVSYDGIPTYINFSCIEGEWYIYFTILEGSLKPVKELVRKWEVIPNPWSYVLQKKTLFGNSCTLYTLQMTIPEKKLSSSSVTRLILSIQKSGKQYH